MKSSGLNPSAALLTIGDELLTGKTVNTNASFLGRVLTDFGFHVAQQRVCSDSIKAICSGLQALQDLDLIIVTGGLGPTPDDVTRDALAAHFAVELRFSKEQHAAMKRVYKKLGKKMPSLSKKEAFYPANAHPLVNRFGIALGFYIVQNKKLIVVLPGVPTELQKMMVHDVLPLLRKYFVSARPDQSLRVKMTGISEPSVMEQLGEDFFDRPFQFGIYPSEGEVQISIRTKTASTLKILRGKIQKRLKPWIYSWNDESLAEVIGHKLLKNKQTLCVAESCTGGSLAHAWIRHAGASSFFNGGMIVYNAAAKKNLGVDESLLKKYGEVSAETAEAMALCARAFWNSSYSLSVTGIAGPAGGSAKKPVGLVFIGLSSSSGVSVNRFLFWGNREQIQRKAVCKAMELLLRKLDPR